jgi:ABC-type sugar transport system ATPase subunit
MTVAARQTAPASLVHADGLVKRFPGVVALSGVDFDLYAGEVHCLVGENGAGKSTLIKILSGFYAPDEGHVLVDGEPLVPDTAAARAAGIATIHQEHNLVPFLSVAENVMLGGWSERLGLVSQRRLRERARKALELVAPRIPLTQPARSLSAAEGQLVEIARALAQDAQVVIMDEPTTSLTDQDVAHLFDLVRDLKERGLALLYVSHKMEEIFALADRITVLRDGSTVTSGLSSEFDARKLVRFMVGEDVEMYSASSHTTGEVVLQARQVSREGVLSKVDLDLRAGEILGLAGLVGAGRSEFARCLFGADPIDEGEILIDRRRVALSSPVSAIRAGIGLVPEERKQQGIVGGMNVRENISLSLLDRIAIHGVLQSKEERDIASRFIKNLDIRTPSMETRIEGLSGGNQQKAVIARWLARRPRVLILDEPTKGIDVGAKAEIHRLIENLARSGVAVLLISSELPELLALSDRVAVMRAGRIVATLGRSEANKESVMSYAAV